MQLNIEQLNISFTALYYYKCNYDFYLIINRVNEKIEFFSFVIVAKIQKLLENYL